MTNLLLRLRAAGSRSLAHEDSASPAQATPELYTNKLSLHHRSPPMLQCNVYAAKNIYNSQCCNKFYPLTITIFAREKIRFQTKQ